VVATQSIVLFRQVAGLDEVELWFARNVITFASVVAVGVSVGVTCWRAASCAVSGTGTDSTPDTTTVKSTFQVCTRFSPHTCKGVCRLSPKYGYSAKQERVSCASRPRPDGQCVLLTNRCLGLCITSKRLS